jgi:hypothetical protein
MLAHQALRQFVVFASLIRQSVSRRHFHNIDTPRCNHFQSSIFRDATNEMYKVGIGYA